MAKRKKYHQSPRDRRHEREGAYYGMARKDYDRADYDWAMMKGAEDHERRESPRYERREHMEKRDMFAGKSRRDREERRDGDMIHEDHSAIANLPREVMMKEYPRVLFDNYRVGDTIRDIDEQMDEDTRGMRRHRSRTKY